MDGLRTIWRAARMPLLYRNFPTAYRNRARPFSEGGTAADVAYHLWNGTTIHGTAGREEVTLINELWIDRCYAAPGFIPEPGWSILDIGANRGVFSLWALHEANNDARIVCYEPSPRIFSYLQRNLDGRIPPEMLHNAAVGATTGEITLFEVIGRSGESTVFRDRVEATGELVVETSVPKIALRDVVAELGPIDLLKIDVEGAEYEILADSPPEALAEVRRIALEYDAVDTRDSSRTAADMFAALGAAGFALRHRDDHIVFLSR